MNAIDKYMKTYCNSQLYGAYNQEVSVLTAAISSRGSSQLLHESERETRSTTFSC